MQSREACVSSRKSVKCEGLEAQLEPAYFAFGEPSGGRRKNHHALNENTTTDGNSPEPNVDGEGPVRVLCDECLCCEATSLRTDHQPYISGGKVDHFHSPHPS